jgi:hypothetical protein
VFGDNKVAAKTFDPILGLAHKISFLFMLPGRVVFRPLIRQVVLLMRVFIKYCRIITAVKINVRFRKKMIGKQSTPITQEDFKNAILPTLTPGKRERLQ